MQPTHNTPSILLVGTRSLAFPLALSRFKILIEITGNPITLK